jgi:hypothetical protein
MSVQKCQLQRLLCFPGPEKAENHFTHHVTQVQDLKQLTELRNSLGFLEAKQHLDSDRVTDSWVGVGTTDFFPANLFLPPL